VTVLDFGNEKLKLRIDVNKAKEGTTICLDNNFIPYFEDFFVYLLGIGKDIYLENLEIEMFSSALIDKYDKELSKK